MNNKQDISKIINTKTTYKIDDFYDPIRIIKVINKINRINLDHIEFAILNKKSNQIEIRAKANSEKYYGTVIISYQIDNHKRFIVAISVIVALLFFCLVFLPLIALAINNWIMVWISLGLCGLWLIAIVFCFAFWPRSSRIKEKC